MIPLRTQVTSTINRKVIVNCALGNTPVCLTNGHVRRCEFRPRKPKLACSHPSSLTN